MADGPTGSNALDRTLAFWQRRYARKLTREDAREINENLVGFFRVLSGWAAAEQADPPTPIASDTGQTGHKQAEGRR